MQRFRDQLGSRVGLAIVLAAGLMLSACGRKGDPLPPATVTSAPATTSDADTK